MRWTLSSTRIAGRGYVYMPDDTPGPMADAGPGVVVSIEDRKPPWIVVDHDLGAVHVARWPGRLWRVEIVDAVSDADVRRAGSAHPLKSAAYTRAVSVRVVDALDASSLFGENGSAVSAVLDAAARLTRRDAEALASGRHPEAGEVYGRAWRRWHRQMGLPLGHHDADWDGVLAVGGAGVRSPVNSGLTLVHSAVLSRAGDVDRQRATRADDDGATVLLDPWSTADLSLLEAAVAVGAPALLDRRDRETLVRGWITAFGPDPRFQ